MSEAELVWLTKVLYRWVGERKGRGDQRKCLASAPDGIKAGIAVELCMDSVQDEMRTLFAGLIDFKD